MIYQRSFIDKNNNSEQTQVKSIKSIKKNRMTLSSFGKLKNNYRKTINSFRKTIPFIEHFLVLEQQLSIVFQGLFTGPTTSSRLHL